MIYYIVILLLFLFTLLEHFGQNGCVLGCKKKEEKCYVFLAMLLLLMSCLRYETGRDWRNYAEYFNVCTTYNFGAELESGYVLLSTFFRKITDDYYVMQFFVAIFTCYIIFSNIYRRSKTPIYTLLIYYLQIYYFALDMTLVRQGLSIAILIIGIKFIEKNEIYRWLFCVIVAMQFHVSAIVAFPLYYTMNYKISRRIALLLLLIVFMTEIAGLSVIRLTIQQMGHCTFLPDRLLIIINRYTHGSVSNRQIQYGTGLGVFCKYVFCLLIILFYNATEDVYMLNFLTGIFLCAVGRNFEVAWRLQFFYMISGNGILAYNCLNRTGWIERIGSVRRCLNKSVFTGLMLLLIIYNVLTFYKYLNYSVDQGGRIRDSFIPYKTILFR